MNVLKDKILILGLSRLTVTKVVFESEMTAINIFVHFRLTVTKVVFECKC